MITVTDDTYRANRMRLVTPEMAIANPNLVGHRLVSVLDQQRWQVQDVVHVDHEYEDRAVWNAAVRARRWIRAKTRGQLGTTPKHIALKMAVFHKADPEGFKAAMQEAVR